MKTRQDCLIINSLATSIPFPPMKDIVFLNMIDFLSLYILFQASLKSDNFPLSIQFQSPHYSITTSSFISHYSYFILFCSHWLLLLQSPYANNILLAANQAPDLNNTLLIKNMITRWSLFAATSNFESANKYSVSKPGCCDSYKYALYPNPKWPRKRKPNLFVGPTLTYNTVWTGKNLCKRLKSSRLIRKTQVE